MKSDGAYIRTSSEIVAADGVIAIAAIEGDGVQTLIRSEGVVADGVSPIAAIKSDGKYIISRGESVVADSVVAILAIQINVGERQCREQVAGDHIGKGGAIETFHFNYEYVGDLIGILRIAIRCGDGNAVCPSSERSVIDDQNTVIETDPCPAI